MSGVAEGGILGGRLARSAGSAYFFLGSVAFFISSTCFLINFKNHISCTSISWYVRLRRPITS